MIQNKSHTPRIAIIAGEFHKELAAKMIKVAQAEIKKGGGKTAQIVKVPGSFEIPLITELLLSQHDIDACVALGFIEKGETLHGEIMGHAVYGELIRLQVKHQKPIGLGIIGPGATPEQAAVRRDGAAKGAVQAALQQYQWITTR